MNVQNNISSLSSQKKHKKIKTRGVLYKHNKRLYYQRIMDRSINILYQLKIEGCPYCSESDPICMEFHHVIKSNYTVLSRRMYSLNTFFKELEKGLFCCANCHLKIHAGRIKICRS